MHREKKTPPLPKMPITCQQRPHRSPTPLPIHLLLPSSINPISPSSPLKTRTTTPPEARAKAQAVTHLLLHHTPTQWYEREWELGDADEIMKDECSATGGSQQVRRGWGCISRRKNRLPFHHHVHRIRSAHRRHGMAYPDWYLSWMSKLFFLFIFLLYCFFTKTDLISTSKRIKGKGRLWTALCAIAALKLKGRRSALKQGWMRPTGLWVLRWIYPWSNRRKKKKLLFSHLLLGNYK